MLKRLKYCWWRLVQTARLMVGVPDYEAYLALRQRYGGTAPPLSRAAFVQHCAERRLGGRRPGKCC